MEQSPGDVKRTIEILLFIQLSQYSSNVVNRLTFLLCFSLTVSVPLVVEVDYPFWQFQPAYMSAKDFRTKFTTCWLWWLTTGSSFKAMCQKQVPFLCLQNLLRHFKREKRNKSKILSEKLHNKLHMKLSFMSSWGGQEWGLDCCYHTVT